MTEHEVQQAARVMVGWMQQRVVGGTKGAIPPAGTITSGNAKSVGGQTREEFFRRYPDATKEDFGKVTATMKHQVQNNA